MGRVSVDLYPEQIGVPLHEVRSFRKALGGSATNVAVQAARLGRRSAVITKVGNDAFGVYVRKALDGFGVDARYVGTDYRHRTPLVFCEVFPPDDFPLLFYREPKAPDTEIEISDLDLSTISQAPLFWTTGTGLSSEPSRSSTLAALRSRKSGVTVHDLDYRPVFWPSEQEAQRWAREALRHATVAVGNVDEARMATGLHDPPEQSRALLDLGVEIAIVKKGGDGVHARTAEGVTEVCPIPVNVLNGLGAGDAFGGALCHGLLLGWGLDDVLRVANAAGALVSTRLLCADDMPAMDEIEGLLGEPAPAGGHTGTKT
jgi:5-dehydro-2-deoxygluconokinase